jgi:hypothetical protein
MHSSGHTSHGHSHSLSHGLGHGHGHSFHGGHDDYGFGGLSLGSLFGEHSDHDSGANADACAGAIENFTDTVHDFGVTAGEYMDSTLGSDPAYDPLTAPTLGDVVSSGLDALAASDAAHTICE